MTTASVGDGREQVGDPLAERAWLVRLCTRFTGDVDVAEDLAQETLLEAWQHAHELRAPEARTAWLAGIARNRCLRWARRRRRDIARLIHVDGVPDAPVTPAARELADDVDLELQLERDELAALLDRALAVLPVETRQILVQRYIEALPQADVAARLGMTEGAVAVRLHRGKVALRRILAGGLALMDPDSIPAQTWQETRIWCPLCGRHRLMGYLGDTGSDLRQHASGRHGSVARPADCVCVRPPLTRTGSDAHTEARSHSRHCLLGGLSHGNAVDLGLPRPSWL